MYPSAKTSDPFTAPAKKACDDKNQFSTSTDLYGSIGGRKEAKMNTNVKTAEIRGSNPVTPLLKSQLP